MKRLVALAALSFFVASGVSFAQDKKTMTANGKVKSVSNESLVVTDKAGKDWTFTIDTTTRFIGKGLSHKSAAAKEAGKSLMATDAVKDGQRVRVKYHDMGGTMHAAEIRIM